MHTETLAYVVESKGQAPVLKKIPLAPLEPEQVEIDMLYCGLCHTDIHMRDNDWGISTYPMVPGHEGTGKVIAIGQSVKNLKVGDKVGVGWIRNSCKSCRECLSGKDNLCENYYQGVFLGKNAGGWGRGNCELQGCFAKIMHIDERFAFKLGDGLQLDSCAPLMCAGITVWEPIVDYVKPGSRVGVVSLGGLGHMAVKLARAVGAEVTVFSSSESKRATAKAIGAHKFINYNNQHEIQSFSLDVIIDTCPVANNIHVFMDCLAFGGTYVRVGIPSATTHSFTYEFIPLVFCGKKIVGSIVSGSKNTNTMLTVADNQGIHCDVDVVPFTAVAETMDALVHKKNHNFRYVLKW